MKLSIIIVNYNTGAVTKGLVESLLAEELPDNTEIIVVDNDSKDESVAFLRSDFPEITVIDNEKNVGLAAGINTALRTAKGEYYLNLNPDMVPLAGSVQTLVDFMDKHPDVGIAGGKLVSPNGRLQYSCYRFYKPMTIIYRRTRLGKTRRGRQEIRRFLMKDFDHHSVRDVDWLMGACLIIRAKAVGDVENWRKFKLPQTPLSGESTHSSPDKSLHRTGYEGRLSGIGGMDERYFLYFEDVDWCRRMWDAGWRVMYVPHAAFSHFYQQSSRHGMFGIITNRATREHIKSAMKYFWKFRGKTLPRGRE